MSKPILFWVRIDKESIDDDDNDDEEEEDEKEEKQHCNMF